MRVLLVLTFDIPDPEDVVAVVRRIDPPSIPHFAGTVDVVVEPHATELIDWLNEDTSKSGEGPRG
jgi:hypothetical protein